MATTPPPSATGSTSEKKRAERVIQSLLETTSSFDPLGFERLVLLLLTIDGSPGSLTPTSGDDGIDVRVQTNAGLVVAQCKAYSADTKVAPREVREFLGAVSHAKAHKGYFVTTSSFTEAAVSFAEANPELELVDRQALTRWVVNIAAETIDEGNAGALPDDGDHGVGAQLRRNASRAKAFANDGRLDEALELVYQLADQIEHTEGRDHRAVGSAVLHGIAEDAKWRAQSLLAEVSKGREKLDAHLGRLAYLETSQEAAYAEKNLADLRDAYSPFGISVEAAIVAMRDQERQQAGGGSWLIDDLEAESGRGIDYVLHYAENDRPTEIERFSADSFIFVFRSPGDWNWLVIDRQSHKPVASFARRIRIE